MRQHVRIMVGGAFLAVLLTGCSGAADTGARTASREPVLVIPSISTESSASAHPYVGMWVTADGHIRQQLLANGRYDEARGDRESAFTGSYRVSGNRIDYIDDTGFTADGTFDGDILHHGGYIFYREGSEVHRQATEDR
uniref:Atu4866 domain-containing protein n=1 Tax=Paractinoplanes polyasparticus TaxID=2856853 RepID=UPI002103D2C4|nr:Atu4866 domain-containing protein [Actinoplanes polyasparticus]